MGWFVIFLMVCDLIGLVLVFEYNSNCLNGIVILGGLLGVSIRFIFIVFIYYFYFKFIVVVWCLVGCFYWFGEILFF